MKARKLCPRTTYELIVYAVVAFQDVDEITREIAKGAENTALS